MDWHFRLKDHLQRLAEPEPLAAEVSRVVSSVLVPIGRNPERKRDEILLTKRTMKVETHKGQVSFPGGLKEDEDPDLLATALREAREEIGTRESDVEVLGRLTPVITGGSGVVIYPWVGKLTFPYPFVLNDMEVDRLLFLPVHRLLEEGLQPVSVPVGTVDVKSIGIVVDDELVWGATAKMLDELRKVLLSLPY